LSTDGTGFEIGRIAALVQGRAVEGRLSYDGEAGLGGELKAASLGLAELAGMALGPLAISEEDVSGWPRGALGPGMLNGLEGRIAVRTDNLDITSGQAAEIGRAHV